MNIGLMWQDRNSILIINKTKRSNIKTVDKFDIYDASTDELILKCREPELSNGNKLMRFIGGGYDEMSGFDFRFIDPTCNQSIFRIEKPSSAIHAGATPIHLYDADNQLIGSVKKRFFSFKKQYIFLDSSGKELFQYSFQSILTGYKFKVEGNEFARLHSIWNGDKKEYMSSGFKYHLVISDEVTADNILRMLFIGLSVCIGRFN